MVNCPTCHQCYYDVGVLPSYHKCLPGWLVWNPEEAEQEDAHVFYAHNAEWAVEAWAERDDSDSADYRIVQGGEAIVCVQPKDGGAIEKYKVTGEYHPSYSAEPVTEKEV